MVKTASTETSLTKTRERSLWDAADKMRNDLEVGEYRNFDLGPIPLKHVSDSFPSSRQRVRATSSIKGRGNQMERR